MNRDTKEFFQTGDDCEPCYKNIRDHCSCKLHKQHIEQLWNLYKPHITPTKKKKFLKDAKNQLFQHYWEMYVFCALRARGFDIEIGGSKGPDFQVQIVDKIFWIEAVAPTVGQGDDQVPDPFKSSTTDLNKIALRFTSALKSKREQYENSLREGLISKNDGYVLAINSFLFYGHVEPYYPFPNFLRGFLPIGDPVVPFNKKTSSLCKPYIDYEEEIQKSSSSLVRKDNFLDKTYEFNSAVLHSAANYDNYEKPLGFDFSILHNPMATNPLSENDFDWCEQFYVRDKVHDITIKQIARQ